MSSYTTSGSSIREQDELARHMPIVLQMAAALKRRLPFNVQRDDLVAAGAYALVDSLRRAATTDAAAFECYLRIRIRGAMMDELRQQDWLPRRMRGAIAQGALERGDGKVVAIDEVSGVDEQVLTDTRTPTPIEQVLAASRSRLVEDAVRRLPPRERTVVQLHYFSEVRFKQIGVLLGVSEPRVSQLHTRALQRLRDLLSPELRAA